MKMFDRVQVVDVKNYVEIPDRSTYEANWPENYCASNHGLGLRGYILRATHNLLEKTVIYDLHQIVTFHFPESRVMWFSTRAAVPDVIYGVNCFE